MVLPPEWRNWCGLESARPQEVYAPRTVDDVVTAVEVARAAGTTVKMAGTGHSFTAIAAPEHTQLLPHQLTGILAVDRNAMTVTARAGTQLHVLNAGLERSGLSLHNMGDIAEQTIAGAVSTGTHGSGGRVASLAAQVSGFELVTGTGEVVRASATENSDVFDIGRVGLGALGVLTSVTFEVEPRFVLRAHERPVTWDEGVSSLLDLAEEHDHVDAYWFPHTARMQVKTNDRVDVADPLPRWRALLDDDLLANRLFAVANRLGTAAPALAPAINQVSARALTERTYADVAHRVFTTPRHVGFKEMEYALPLAAAVDALGAARRAIEASDWRISFPVEIRVVPADDIPLSSGYGRDSVYLAFHTWVGAEHRPYFAGIERIMRDHDGRPHWGKLHTRTAEDLAPAYPLFDEFLALRDRLDPDRVFDNAYLR
ncbi:D-arabinono-1,4-lactone oxidase, partial [Nocardioides sp.]|uniref:D-arabinono-1,4-lactone oxidase n=1 Tax=Nocardioides sp. TaxID=35761 RepID=UPI002ED3366E